MFFYLCVFFLVSPRGFLSAVIFSSQSFKRRKYGIEASVLTLCFKPCVVFDNYEPFRSIHGMPQALN